MCLLPGLRGPWSFQFAAQLFRWYEPPSPSWSTPYLHSNQPKAKKGRRGHTPSRGDLCSIQGAGWLFHSDHIHQGVCGVAFAPPMFPFPGSTFKTENLTPAWVAPQAVQLWAFPYRLSAKGLEEDMQDPFFLGFGFETEPHRSLEEGLELACL